MSCFSECYLVQIFWQVLIAFYFALVESSICRYLNKIGLLLALSWLPFSMKFLR